MAGSAPGSERDGRSARYLNRGNQGAVYVIGEGAARIVVKQPLGRGLRRRLSRWMLDREYAAYQRMAGIHGIPRCLGRQQDGGLLLEYIEGEPFHESLPALTDRTAFFTAFRDIILAMHRAGVAHGDLKRRGNVLVTPAGDPVLLDFGASIVNDAGAGWLRQRAFGLLCRMDFNAWIKLKYRRRYDEITPEDRPYFRPTFIEDAARVVRRVWRKLTGRRWRKAWRRRRAERRAGRS